MAVNMTSSGHRHCAIVVVTYPLTVAGGVGGGEVAVTTVAAVVAAIWSLPLTVAASVLVVVARIQNVQPLLAVALVVVGRP